MGLVFLLWSVNYHSIIQIWRKIRELVLQSPTQSRVNYEFRWSYSGFFSSWSWNLPRTVQPLLAGYSTASLSKKWKKPLCDKQSGLLISVYACCLPFSYYTPLVKGWLHLLKNFFVGIRSCYQVSPKLSLLQMEQVWLPQFVLMRQVFQAWPCW